MSGKSSELEYTVEDYLVASVELEGGVALKLRPPTGRGFPDRTVLLPGPWTAFAEVKRPKGGRFAKHQAEWFVALRAAGHLCFLLSSKADVDEMMATYRRWKNDQR